MTRCEILRAAHDAGVVLTIEGDALRYRAPTGALTCALRAALVAIKLDLLEEYGERAAICEYDAGLARLEAERRASETALGKSQTGLQRDLGPGAATVVLRIARDNPSGDSVPGRK